MSSGNEFERLWRVQATVNKLVLDGKRDPEKVADALQALIDEKSAVAELTEKFALLVDLGIITVPKGYVHANRLASFRQENHGWFYGYNDAITDANFPKPSRILKPGDKLQVCAWKQVVPGTTTSEERMAFLATLKSHHTGAQGVSIVFEQKCDQLPKGYWYASFDERGRLWKDADCDHRVPCVSAYSDGDFFFYLGSFESPWNDRNACLSFCDVA